MAAAGQCRSAISAVQGAADLPALIGAAYRGVNTDIEPIKYTVQFAESIASGNLPQKTAEWLLCRDYGTRLADLRMWLGGAQDCAARLRAHHRRPGDAVGSRVLERQCRQSLGQPAGARRIRAREPRRAGAVESFSSRPNPEPGKRPRQTHGAWRKRAPWNRRSSRPHFTSCFTTRSPAAYSRTTPSFRR